MRAKEFFLQRGIDLDAEFNRSKVTMEFKSLLKTVKKAAIPEGNIDTEETKEWYIYKLGICVTKMDDEELEEAGMLKAWSKRISQLPIEVYLDDMEEMQLKTRKDLQDYLKYRAEHDIWVEPFVNECACAGFDLHTDVEEEIGRNSLQGIVSEDLIRNTMQTENKLMLIYPDLIRSLHPQVMPIRYTAFPDVCGRARLFGGTMELTQDKGLLKALPAMIKAQWFSTAFSLNGDTCKILIRDGKVSSMKSRKYVIFPEIELVNALEEELYKEWPDTSYLDGSVSHEYFSINYMLNATDMEESFKLMLENLGVNDCGNIKAGVRLSTSDIGNSSVVLAPFYLLNGQVMNLGKAIRIRHDNGNDMDVYKKALETIGCVFREAEERIEELGNTDIKDPVTCFNNIVEQVNLSKTITNCIADNLEKQFPDGCTAVDIFIALNQTIEVYKSVKNPSLTDLIQYSEQINKLMYIDYTKFDA